MCFAFHVSRSDKESEMACATKKTTPAKRQSRRGGLLWARSAGKVIVLGFLGTRAAPFGAGPSFLREAVAL